MIFGIIGWSIGFAAIFGETDVTDPSNKSEELRVFEFFKLRDSIAGSSTAIKTAAWLAFVPGILSIILGFASMSFGIVLFKSKREINHIVSLSVLICVIVIGLALLAIVNQWHLNNLTWLKEHI